MSLCHYEKDPSKLILFKIKNFEWVTRHFSQLILVLQGFLVTLNTHFEESWLVTLYQELH